jgi:hypothetical protein
MSETIKEDLRPVCEYCDNKNINFKVESEQFGIEYFCDSCYECWSNTMLGPEYKVTLL